MQPHNLAFAWTVGAITYVVVSLVTFTALVVAGNLGPINSLMCITLSALGAVIMGTVAYRSGGRRAGEAG